MKCTNKAFFSWELCYLIISNIASDVQHFSDLGQAKGSKLLRRLLKLDAVTSVFLGRDFISVNKTEDANWGALKPIVLDAMMDAFGELESKGVPIIAEVTPSNDTRITEDDDEVTAMIKELLETRIRPAVQEDGGDIFFMCVCDL